MNIIHKIEKKYKLFEVSFKGKVQECESWYNEFFDTHEEALAELSRKAHAGELHGIGTYIIMEVYVKSVWDAKG